MVRTWLAVTLAALGTALMAAVAWAGAPVPAPQATGVASPALSVAAVSSSNSAVRSALRSRTATDARTTSQGMADASPASTARTAFEPAGMPARGGAASTASTPDDGSDSNVWVILTGLVLVLLVAARRGRRF